MASNITKSLTSAEETLEETSRLSEPKNKVKTHQSLQECAISLYLCSLLGIRAGVHRLWSHRSYKAKWPLQILLVIFNTIAHQITDKLHHKYSETDTDPHNAKNGFFFAHVGWLLCKKHPDVAKKGKEIDFSEFEKQSYIDVPKKILHVPDASILIVFHFTDCHFCLLLERDLIERLLRSHYFVLRYVFTLTVTWLVNSAAHMFGNKSYDRYINPSENKMVAITTLGEGWHNCHHVFPWDYKAAELGNYRFNISTAFIDFFVKLGLAYDLKIVSKDVVHKRMQRTGDGSHDTANLWGWGDKDQTKQDIDVTMVLKKEY